MSASVLRHTMSLMHKTLLHVFFYVVIQTCCIVNTGHIHRQNRLEEHGVKIAVQKLERTEHSVLKNV